MSDKLSKEELVAWDQYASHAVCAALTCWFRWKQGCPVDRPAIVVEAASVADLLLAERRKR